MVEIKEKHAKRIHDLIKAKWAATVLLVLGLLLPLLSPVAILVCLLYGFESSRFLRMYPDMDENHATDLASARKMYYITASVHIGLWVLVAVVAAIIINSQPS